MRTFLTYFVLAGLLVCIGWLIRLFLDDLGIIPPDDDVEYWAAGRLNLRGENPYDPLLLYPLEMGEARRIDVESVDKSIAYKAVMMWNPPWTLVLAMPMATMPHRVYQLVWMVASILIVGLCAVLLWDLYGGSRGRRAYAVVLAMTFLPVSICLRTGQISAWILLGATLFLHFESRGCHYLAGAAGVLMAIKPQLVYLFWPILLGWSFLDRRGWKIIAGGLGAGAVCTLIPLAFNPSVLGQYWEAWRSQPPERFSSPTLGTLLRRSEAEALHSFAVQFLPMFLGMLWFAAHAWVNSSRRWVWHERMPAILLASFATAPYGAWPFDLVILVAALIDIACRVERAPQPGRVVPAVAAFLAFTVPLLVVRCLSLHFFWYFWVAPLLFLEYAILNRIIPRPEDEAMQK